MKKKTRLLGLSCIVALGILAGCNKDDDSASEPVKRETPVEVEEVLYGSLSDSNRLTGTIEPETEVEVMPKAAGEFTKILVKKGDVVKSGQVLAQLDDADERNAVKQQEAALKQAQSGLKSAQSSLNSAQSGKTKAEKSYQQSQASVRQGEASLAEARKSKDDNLDNLDFQIKNAKLAWDQAKQNLERMKALHEEGLISEQNYEDAVNGEQNAKIAYDQVVLNKDQAGSDISMRSLEASLDQARIGASIAQSSIQDAVIAIAQAQAQVEQAQAQVEQAQLSVTSAKDRLSDKQIIATASGEITEVSGEVGAMASGQNPFATIVSINKVKISANILPAQLASFKNGDAVNVEVSGLSQNFTGIVSYVSAVSSGSGLFTIEAEVDNSEQLIRPGMVASIVVNEVLEDNSLLVPTTAIIDKEGKSYVFTIEEEHAVQKEVEVLRYGTETTAVSGELSEHEKVVTKGQNLLQDGDTVKIMEED